MIGVLFPVVGTLDLQDMTVQSELPTPLIDATDTALLIEGGGMRCSYTAAAVDYLMGNGVQFGWVGGISGGASHSVSYLSGERDRVRNNFVDFAADPNFGGVTSLLRGRGYFNAEYIYGRAPELNIPRPFDYQAVMDNPAQLCVTAVDIHTGEPYYWTKEDISGTADLMLKVRASSTLPFLMTIPTVDGKQFIDGALGPSGGIPLEAARAAGFTKFFVLLTRPRGFRKTPMEHTRALRRVLRRYPVAADLLESRHERYNQTLDSLYELESEGSAYLFTPEGPLVTSTERKIQKLRASFAAGAAQSEAEWPRWQEFLTSPPVARS